MVVHLVKTAIPSNQISILSTMSLYLYLSMPRQHLRRSPPPLSLAASEEHYYSSSTDGTIRPTLPVIPNPRSYRQRCGSGGRMRPGCPIHPWKQFRPLSLFLGGDVYTVFKYRVAFPQCFFREFFPNRKPTSSKEEVSGLKCRELQHISIAMSHLILYLIRRLVYEHFSVTLPHP